MYLCLKINLMNKRILITGASGFIGSFLVEKALAEDYETWAGVRKSSNKSYLQDTRIHSIDLLYADKEKLKQQLQEHVANHGKWDYIIHNAGVTKCLNPEDFNLINFRYTVNLIDALQETGNIPEKFVLMSSLSACYPGTKYGESKLKAEEYLRSQTGFPFMIMRPTGVYGPREKDYFLMMKTVQAGLDVAAGWKEQQLSFIYVTDLVQAVFLSLKTSLQNKIYPVTDGQIYTDKQYTQMVKKALGKKHVLRIKVPLSLLYLVSVISEGFSRISGKASTLNRDKYKIMKQRDWTCDVSALFEDLSFVPAYDLNKGIDACVNWYRKNGWLK